MIGYFPDPAAPTESRSAHAPPAAFLTVIFALLLANLVAAPAAAQDALDVRPDEDPAARWDVYSDPATTYSRLSSADHEGAAAFGLALRRLGSGERALMIAAHPDDENTSLLAALALGSGADVAYLSLTRGEGGQNGIGPELQESLGLLRSEELLAARRLDGARQFFTRAYDFGYSKTAEETLDHWPRDSILADAVLVIRRFRPDVVISVFSGTPRDGHGHHQTAGIIAREAFEVAGDPSRFPGQLADGLHAHQPALLYQSLWRGSDDPYATIPTGRLDPLFGRSHHQIAMASRSRHQSQDMGQAQEPGPNRVAVELLATAPGYGEGSRPSSRTGTAEAGNQRADEVPGAVLFEGIATTLPARAGAAFAAEEQSTGEADRDAWTEVEAELERYQRTVQQIRDDVVLLNPGPSAERLTTAANLLVGVDSMLGRMSGPAAAELRFHVREERSDVEAALALGGGVHFDAIAGESRVVPGQELPLELRVWNGGPEPIRVTELRPLLPEGWEAVRLDSDAATSVGAGELLTRPFAVRVPAAAEASEPYFLQQPRAGAVYTWPDVAAVRGLPFERDPIRGAALLEIEGTPVRLERAAEHVAVDKTVGEIREPVLVVPAVSVLLEPELAVLPASPVASAASTSSATVGAAATGANSPPSALDFQVRLAAEAPEGIAGVLRLETPRGWRAEPSSVRVEFDAPGTEEVADFAVQPPPAPAPGRYAVRARFEADDGRVFDTGYRMVDYPHIRPRPIFAKANAEVEALDIRVPTDLRVGYVTGAGDHGPDVLRQLGLAVDLLEETELTGGDLERYDVIVTGIRAYEFRDDLAAANARLLEYVEDGGTLIVQYNKYEFDTGEFAPYPLSMSRPHDRVTDQSAPVTILDPEHRVFRQPNRITGSDFEGWVQERGLYFAGTWDDRYTPLLEMNDPGEDPLRGSLLVAQIGEGTYVYTGLAFFRQFPAGVAGAYRLFANLLALGAQ